MKLLLVYYRYVINLFRPQISRLGVSYGRRTPETCPVSWRRGLNRNLVLSMGKNKKRSGPIDESHLDVSERQAGTVRFVDTHTHLLSTFSAYRSKYPLGKYETVYDFVQGLYGSKKVDGIIDVFCEAPVQSGWKELADSALSPEKKSTQWGGIDYWFVMGASTTYMRLLRVLTTTQVYIRKAPIFA